MSYNPTGTPPLNFYDYAVSELLPKRQTITWSKTSARYLISVTNQGDSSAIFRLEGADGHGDCRFEFQPPGESTLFVGPVEFLLPREERAIISVQVSPPAAPLANFHRRRHHFTITVTVPQSGQMGKSVLGQLAHKPLIGPGLMLVMAVAVGLWGLLAAPPLINYFSNSTKLVAMNETIPSESQGLMPADVPALPDAPLPAEPDAPLTFEEMFQEIAPRYDLDWRLVEAVAFRESRMNYLAMGRARDMGLMQIIPATWNEWAPKANVIDPFDPYSNITVGAAYLAFVRDFCNERGYSDPRWMLVAYNWGPNRLDRFWTDGGTWNDLPLTQRNYAVIILSIAAQRASNPTLGQAIYADIEGYP